MALSWTKLVVLLACWASVLGQKPKTEDLAKATNILALDLHKELRNGNDNVFTSPLSISAAMAMVYLGARGETSTEMRSALGYEGVGLEDDEVHKAFKKLLNIVTGSSDDEYQLDIANAALVQEGYPIVEKYIKELRKNYDAKLESVDFASDGEDIKNDINEWVEEKTRGKIEDLLEEPLDADTRLMLLNAIYFKGTWITQFDTELTESDTFYNQGITETSVPTMQVESYFKYAKIYDLNVKALELPYEGEDISMLVILPEDKDGLQDFADQLTIDIVDQITRQLWNQTVEVKLPKFKLETEYSLVDTLSELGLKSLFGYSADLSGISSRNDLFVSDVMHKAVVEVNEEGSEAAAVTGVIIETKSFKEKPVFVADHPFLFLIRDSRTNAILFIGEVNEL